MTDIEMTYIICVVGMLVAMLGMNWLFRMAMRIKNAEFDAKLAGLERDLDRARHATETSKLLREREQDRLKKDLEMYTKLAMAFLYMKVRDSNQLMRVKEGADEEYLLAHYQFPEQVVAYLRTIHILKVQAGHAGLTLKVCMHYRESGVLAPAPEPMHEIVPPQEPQQPLPL